MSSPGNVPTDALIRIRHTMNVHVIELVHWTALHLKNMIYGAK